DRSFTHDWRDAVNAVLVLGTGGAAHSVISAITAQGKKAYVLGRSVVSAARLASEFELAELYSNQAAELIVNCTPLGLNGEDALSAFCVLPAFEYAFDLVYSDALTPFLRRCRNNGSKVADGADMLVYQAIEGDKILLKRDFDVEAVYKTAVDILKSDGVLRG
ncbi:MAG: hypothetical protein K2L88_00630, partial [Clostridiales bacterium]|nr:hypothetical protein [Clostridiales bacterium]